MKYKHLRKFVNRRIKEARIKARQQPSDTINHAILNAWQKCRKSLILKIKRDRKEGRQDKKIRKFTSSMKRTVVNGIKAAEALNKLSGTLQELSREGKLAYLTYIANRRYPRSAYPNYNK